MNTCPLYMAKAWHAYEPGQILTAVYLLKMIWLRDWQIVHNKSAIEQSPLRWFTGDKKRNVSILSYNIHTGNHNFFSVKNYSCMYQEFHDNSVNNNDNEKRQARKQKQNEKSNYAYLTHIQSGIGQKTTTQKTLLQFMLLTPVTLKQSQLHHTGYIFPYHKFGTPRLNSV